MGEHTDIASIHHIESFSLAWPLPAFCASPWRWDNKATLNLFQSRCIAFSKLLFLSLLALALALGFMEALRLLCSSGWSEIWVPSKQARNRSKSGCSLISAHSDASIVNGSLGRAKKKLAVAHTQFQVARWLAAPYPCPGRRQPILLSRPA